MAAIDIPVSIRGLDFDLPPSDPADPPVAQGDPAICGICGQEKVRLSTKTTFRRYDVFICTTIPPQERMPCDGFVWKNAVLNGSA